MYLGFDFISIQFHLGILSLRFRVQRQGFNFHGPGFQGQGLLIAELGFRVWYEGFTICSVRLMAWGLGFRIYSVRYMIENEGLGT